MQYYRGAIFWLSLFGLFYCSSMFMISLIILIVKCKADPPQNCHLTVKKLPGTYFFFKKIAKNCQKNDNFCQFKKKKSQVFGNFLTVKWQFSGGSAPKCNISMYSHTFHRFICKVHLSPLEFMLYFVYFFNKFCM